MSKRDNIDKLMSDKDVQFRSFNLTNFETRKSEDESTELVVEGKAATIGDETILFKDKDYEAREIIERGAFDNADMSDVIFNYNHSGRVYARTRNNTLKLDLREDGLYMIATLRANDQGHKELYEDIKSGTIDRMSFAFHVSENDWETKENDETMIDVRHITNIDKIYDVSAVDIPAYDETDISARSAFNSVREERLAVSKRKAEELELAKAKYEYLIKGE